MRIFIILWLGQLASAIGSHMTYFALTLWVWQKTESATAIALILFFYQLPQIAIALFSGILVDRVSRKQLLILSDTASACCTLSVGLLATMQALQIWHLYLIAAIIGCFGHIQTLTYTTTVPLLVPPQHHVRATSMGAIAGYSTNIFAPALAGLLYPWIGLLGITVIDLVTFAMAIVGLLLVSVPSVNRASYDHEQASAENGAEKCLWQDITFGFRYIRAHPKLRAMVVVLSTFVFLDQVGEILYQPMILAQTNGNAQMVGMVAAASGVGGVIGGAILAVGGGFRDRIVGIWVGMLGVGISKLIFGLGRHLIPWMGARLGASLSEPLIFSSYTAVWYAEVPPALQGRVFAADHLIGLVIGAAASLIAGPLADYVFEPALQPTGYLAPILGMVLGTGDGTGMALLYVLTAGGLLLVSAMCKTLHSSRHPDT
ncbi:MAG: MFS transporter [Cyanobacteria bacterium P01_A01_bin.123]